MPFTLAFPDGWVSGPPGDIESYLSDLAKTNPTLAAQLRENNSLQTSEFVAYEVSSDSSLVANVACTTQSTEGSPTAAILDLAEQQNVESIAALPETTVAPKADRIKLPIGDVLRVRWGFVIDAPETSVGYLFVSGSLVVTCVFSSASDVVDTKEPAWRAILATFKPRP